LSYLLDTDIISNLLRRTPSTTLIRRLAAVAPEDQHTSSITLGELVYGAHRVPERTEQLLEKIDAVIPTHLPALPFDDVASRHYGVIRADLERAGTPIGEADMRIAAIALARGLAVVTGNGRHFERVPGLHVENWLEEARTPRG
jgi:tRNA(fMet)-specific endonuclease VapC